MLYDNIDYFHFENNFISKRELILRAYACDLIEHMNSEQIQIVEQIENSRIEFIIA